MSMRIRELPEDDRPRERLASRGSNSLSEAELLAILLSTGRRGQNVISLAQQLLATFKSLNGLARASVKELQAIPGIGPAKASNIAAAFGLGHRLTAETLIRTKVDSPQIVCSLLGAEMQSLSKEALRVILLDTRHHLIRIEDVSLGSLNESIAHPREIFQPAIRYGAYGFIIVHNHPSGDPSPSESDHRLTRRLAEAALLLKILLIDHIILGAPSENRPAYFSFREAGML